MAYAAPPPAQPGSPAAQRPVSTANVVVTVVLFLVLLAVGALAVVMSGFFVMASDSCGSPTANCDTDWILYGLVATWGGVVVAVVGATVGTLVAGLRHRATWYFPLIGVAVVLVGFVVGLALAGRVGAGSP